VSRPTRAESVSFISEKSISANRSVNIRVRYLVTVSGLNLSRSARYPAGSLRYIEVL
jgi:hypothetical protein